MSIIVVTPEHGEREFEATDWETMDGLLWIGNGEVGVAEFNRGAWLFVYETKPETAAKEPRIWEDCNDIPEGVVTVDDTNSYRKWVGGIRYMDLGVNDGVINWDAGEPFSDDNNDWVNDYGPFTEVLS